MIANLCFLLGLDYGFLGIGRNRRPRWVARGVRCGWLGFGTLLLGFGLPWSAWSSMASPWQMPALTHHAPSHGDVVGSAASVSQEPQSWEQVKRAGGEISRYRQATMGPLGPSGAARSATQVPGPRLAEFAQAIRPLLTRACGDCHGPDVQEGNLRLDELDADVFAGPDVDWWTEVLAVVSKGEMPPAEAPPLSDDESRELVDWLATELQAAARFRRQTADYPTFRRLTRYEFNYALQDLLGLPWDFSTDLPPEAHSADGFQNSAELLQMSVTQLEAYHRLARKALQRATVSGDQPPPLHWGISMTEAAEREWVRQTRQLAETTEALQDDPVQQKVELEKLEQSFRRPHPRAYYQDLSTGRTAVATWEYYAAQYAHAPNDQRRPRPDRSDQVAILPAGQWLNIELGNQLPDEGTMRVQVWAARTAVEEGRFPSLQLHFGWQASNEGRALLRVRQEDLQVQAEPGQFQVYQWDIPLGEIYPRNSVRKTSPLGATPSPSEYIRLVNSSASPDEIAIDFVSVEVPVFAQWPPASHRRVFPQPALANDDPLVSAHEILKSFMPRAWRRPVSDQEIQQKLQLFQRLRPDCNSFAEAMIEVLATVLAAPHFLYIGSVDSADPGTDPQDLEQRAKLSALELASRLSFFLWCSIPDDTLRQQAASGQLLNPDVLAAEIERMLADERADRFSQEFVRQWLDLQLLDHLDLRPHLPQFDPLLKDAMRHEPIALFQEMLVRNESVLNFVHADYTMANERLARHYGLSDVFGNHFRRVGLPDDFRRGGLLTQPGLLAMNSDYPDSHPLKRGIWLLESLLNDPPPPPPPAVPEIDLANPEIAKMTLLERIEDHRNHPACLSCHVKIDPWGIAFENYDAVGKWRDMVGDRPVEASSQLYNQQTLAGMDGLKRYLLASRQDQMVDALVHKVATFALGRPLIFSDRAELETIAAEVRRQGDGLRTLVSVVARSDLFRSR